MTGDETGPPQGSAGPPAVDAASVTCPTCGRGMVRGEGNGDDLGPAGQPIWLCNGGPGQERHPWVWRERIVPDETGPTEGPQAGVLARDALRAILTGGGRALRVEIEDALKAALADPAVARMGVTVPIHVPAEVQGIAELVQADQAFQAREQIRAMLTRRGIRLHDDVLDELALMTSPSGVQWDQAERERATRRVLQSMRQCIDEELPIGVVLVACHSAVGAVLDFPGADPLRTPGLESRSTDPPAVQDESLLDQAQVDIELGDLKTIARDNGWDKAFDWIVHHQNEADRVMVDFDPPPLDADVTRCEKCILQSEQRGVPYQEVYDANHDHTGQHVGPDSSPSEAVDLHVHKFETTGRMDTGFSPPRREWRCVCGEAQWLADPRGPEVTP